MSSPEIRTTDSRSESSRLKKPKEWSYVQRGESEYNGRHFFGEHSDDIAELHYLRDWKRWAEQELKSLNAFYRGVNEALNSGDGSYRP